MKKISLLVAVFLQGIVVCAQTSSPRVEENFFHPPASAKPWVFWYWMHAAVSKEAISADLEAMKRVGIGGAYLMPIKDTSSAIPFTPTVRQLSPEWWQMVKFAMQEAKRLDLKLAMHVSDGFALAGGPWITPDLSMQKIVWTRTYIKGGTSAIKLAQPETKENYYKDVAVFAYPAKSQAAFSGQSLMPEVTTSNGTNANYLANRGGKESFRSDTNAWIQYKYAARFNCRSITIHVGGINYQAQRLLVQASDDGINFKTITRLVPPRHGWQDTDEDYTYAIEPTTAYYFRFVYNKEGTEPGAEDLETAKWKPSLKVNGIYLSDEPTINQFETKNGSVWRVAPNTTDQEVPKTDAVPLESIVDLRGKMDGDGNLKWTPPSGNWVIVRIGHTSTGHTNYTGGAGLGLECDKFNVNAVKKQFDNWFAKALEQGGPTLAGEVLKILHVDSWECGSQNWSPVFANEFRKRRGYDLHPFLLVMTGTPVQDATTSEKVLYDIRLTIAEMINDVFYTTLKNLAHQRGVIMSAESVAPTMVSDGLLHYKSVDWPMGEFWINSPTHDKPNDMLDAISGAHIYNKNIIPAESFTSVRMNWGEHPGNLKTVGDRNFALGINKMVIHVFTPNPWKDRKPGMTLDGVGLYFQRDQTWFNQCKAWIEYLTRSSAMLQAGKPVVDIAVFIGEEIPRRSILPDRLVNVLPGIIGAERVEETKRKLMNAGQPMRQIPDGVTHSANMSDPEDWVDPLNGYAYDSFNPDALMMMTVKNGRVILPGGTSYSILVIPGKHPMHSNNTSMSLKVARKILQLVNDGATIIMDSSYGRGIGLNDNDAGVRQVIMQLFSNKNRKGKLLLPPYTDASFAKFGLHKDVEVTGDSSRFAWTHRKNDQADIYFISNQEAGKRKLEASFRVTGKELTIYDPVTGQKIYEFFQRHDEARTYVELELEANQSLFFVFEGKYDANKPVPFLPPGSQVTPSQGKWAIQFDSSYGGPKQPVETDEFRSWTSFSNPSMQYYSGTAVYTNQFNWNVVPNKRTWIQFDSICNIATIKVNGIDCGTLWTPPLQLEVTKALKNGANRIEIAVTNTWHNRLIGDQLLPQEKRVTWTTAPFRLRGKPLLPAGIIGQIRFISR